MDVKKPNADWEGKAYAFFCHRDCEYFPCHKGVPEEDFNCLFCYCPLYFLGPRCGGHFTYTKKGVKNCVNCTVPHERKNFGRIVAILRANLDKAGREPEK